MADEFDKQDYILDVEWRWTSVPVSVVGLHASVLLGFPLVFAALLSKWAFLVWVLYIALVAILHVKHGLSPFDYAKMRFTRLVTGNRWSVR